MNIGYHSDFMDRIIERANKRNERTEKMINKMLDKSEPILNAGKPKPQTNEEWLRSCTTEQLAEFLIASIKKCKSCASGIGVDEVQHCPFGECGCHFKGEVIKWLKQPHGGES